MYLKRFLLVCSIGLLLISISASNALQAQETPSNVDPGGICVRVDRAQLTGLPLPEALMIIIDRSGSMNEPSQAGPSRMEVAKNVLLQYINEMPPDATMGIREYGYGSSCQGTRLLYPISPVNHNSLRQIIRSLSPDGDTPIAYTLEQLPRDLAGIDGKKEILLVTDGQETCGGDPVSVAARLAAADPDLSINVIGFEIVDVEAQLNLRGIPHVARGIYISAESQQDLLQALSVAVRVPFYVYDEDGSFLGEGLSNRTTYQVDAKGTYLVEIPGLAIKQQMLSVERGRGTTLWVEANSKITIIENDARCIAELCPNVPLPRLIAGERARTTYEDPRRPLRVRTLPGLNGEVIDQMKSGELVEVIDGPICNDSYLWWFIDNGKIRGWSAEGIEEFYYMEPLP